MKGAQCYEIFGGIALRNQAFSSSCNNSRGSNNDSSSNYEMVVIVVVLVMVVSSPHQSQRCGVRRVEKVLAADNFGRQSGREEATSIRISSAGTNSCRGSNIDSSSNYEMVVLVVVLVIIVVMVVILIVVVTTKW